jgi:hypothetical protein
MYSKLKGHIYLWDDVLDDIHLTPTFAPKLLYYVLQCHVAHSVFIEIRLEATISERVQITCIGVENRESPAQKLRITMVRSPECVST